MESTKPTEPKKMQALKYNPYYLLSLMNHSTIPIAGLVNIPWTVPIDNNKNSIVLNIRKLFNIVTPLNIDEIKKELRHIVTSHLVKTPENNISEEMNNISNEMLNNFVVYESNIKIYMQMLNAIFNIVVSHVNQITCEPVQSKQIAYFFLQNCKALLLKYISEENIRSLAMKDCDDENEQDLFNKEKNKIFNLITTVCALYDQRLTNNIKLTANQIYGVLSEIMDKHIDITIRICKIGNPYEGNECENEEEFECLYNMRTMYAEQIMIFLKNEYNSFIDDKTVINLKVPTETGVSIKNKTLNDLLVCFKTDIYPHISEPHLKIRCEEFIKI